MAHGRRQDLSQRGRDQAPGEALRHRRRAPDLRLSRPFPATRASPLRKFLRDLTGLKDRYAPSYWRVLGRVGRLGQSRESVGATVG